jgi:protocatechuate 3,4-dioxygenase beta subunit
VRRATVVALVIAGLLAAVLAWWLGRAGPASTGAELASGAEAPAELAAERTPDPEPRRSPRPAYLLTATPAADRAAGNGTFAGRVVSTESGDPVPGAELTFSHQGTAASVRSGADGRWEFAAPRPGRYELAAVVARGYVPFAPEWGHSPIALTATAGQRIEGVTLFLAPVLELDGRVEGPDGQAVEGAEVRLLGASTGERALLPLPDRWTSGPDGAFRAQVAEGALLEARKDGFAPGRAEVDFTARAARRVTVRLGPAGAAPPAPLTISGTVLDPAGVAAFGAVVEADPAGRDTMRPVGQAVVNEQGRFSLHGLDPGLYTVRAMWPGYRPAVARRVAAGTADLALRLAEGASLRGRVRAAATGEPVTAFTVEVVAVRGLRRLQEVGGAFVDARGEFAMAGLAPGDHEVLVAAYGFAPSEPVLVRIGRPGEPAAEVEISLERGGRVFGVVVDEQTRKPIPSAQVSAEGRMGDAASALPVLASARTDQEGRFELSGLGRGLSSIVAAAADHHGRILSGLQVDSGGSVGPLTIELAPTRPGEDPRVELVGIGAVLEGVDDALVVRRVMPGGGAAEANLQAGDQVTSIDGAPVVQMGFNRAIQSIRGPEGSAVRLGVRRQGAEPAVEMVILRRRIRG